MLCVVTFAGFLPSLTSSSVVCADPAACARITRAASSHSLFMTGLRLFRVRVQYTGTGDAGGAENAGFFNAEIAGIAGTKQVLHRLATGGAGPLGRRSDRARSRLR